MVQFFLSISTEKKLKELYKKIDSGVMYMLGASVCFALVGAFAKVLSASLPSVEIVFFRNFFTLLLIVSTIYKYPIQQKGGRPYLLFFRALMGLLGILAFYYNIAHITLADAMTFSRTSPIWTAIFAYIFLKEKIGKKGWFAVFVGFIGVVLIMKPNGENFLKADIIGIFSGIAAGLAYTSIRELKKFYDTRVIIISFMVLGSFFPAVFMLVSKYCFCKELDFIFAHFIMPENLQWIYILFLGMFSAIAQTLMTKAYGYSKAAIVGISSYSVIIFSILVGFALGDPLPDIIGFLGILLVIFGGVLVAFK